MKTIPWLWVIFFALPPATASQYCGQKFDTLEELRVSTFDQVASAPTEASCLQFAEAFLKKAGKAPKNCAGASALVKDWSDSYHSDTLKTLPANPTLAYSTLKQWAYQTFKTKCSKRQYE